MSYQQETTFSNVTVTAKANCYFDNKVVSHAFTTADGAKKTLGIIFPGSFTFNTGAPERMEIVAGSCRVKVAEASEWSTFSSGTYFDVPGNSSFVIEVTEGVAEYICSFL